MAASFLQHESDPLGDLIGSSVFEEAFEEAGVDFAGKPDEIYNPATTLWAMLSQPLHHGEERSCTAAVARVTQRELELTGRVCGTNTGAFCRARQKIPFDLLAGLVRRVSQDAERVAGGAAQVLDLVDDQGRQRRVLLGDGTTFLATDTPKNQRAFPQNPRQKEGLGQPILRCVTLTSLQTGMVVNAECGPYSGKETGETALLREMLGSLKRGDVLVLDSYYGSYWLLATCRERGIDVIVKNHSTREDHPAGAKTIDGRRRTVVWKRPARRDWMTSAEHKRYPESMEVGLVDVAADDADSRSEGFTVATTLLDPDEVSAEEIGELYRSRWLIELDIRTIKQTMGLDFLRAQSPGGVLRELWCGLLSYNLVRARMLQSAASEEDRAPRTLSFARAKVFLTAGWSRHALGGIGPGQADLGRRFLLADRNGHRPGRVEPRAVKRRSNPISLLTVSRSEWKRQHAEAAKSAA